MQILGNQSRGPLKKLDIRESTTPIKKNSNDYILNQKNKYEKN